MQDPELMDYLHPVGPYLRLYPVRIPNDAARYAIVTRLHPMGWTLTNRPLGFDNTGPVWGVLHTMHGGPVSPMYGGAA